VDRREKSGAKPEQLRCCNWIRFPTSQSFVAANGEGGRKVRPANAGPKTRSQNIRPVRLIRARECALEKTSSQKEE
jgi:hypothetical protein